MALKVRAKREATDMLSLFRELDNAFAARFRKTQARAERAVEACREDQRRAGYEPDVVAGWTTEEMAHACKTRVDFLQVLWDRLLRASQNVV